VTPADHDRARFVSAVAARLGLRVDPERSAEVIERRAAHHREPIAAYLARLDAADPPELRALATELTVGETYFFRHIEQYRAFADLAVPDRMTRGRLRVLSAGCSSGEEAYTLAMVLREAHAREAFEIRAIDVNPAAIARARAGRYSRWSLRATTPACEQRWFQTSGRDVVVAPELRAAVTFDQANLLDDGELATAERWDIVFCRNVIMYFTDDRADALIARIARSLVPGGYLFLGHAETLRGRTDDFALCHTHGAFYYQRYPATIAISAGVLAMPAMNGGHAELSAGPLDARWVDEIRAATQRVHAMIDVALDQVPGPEPLPAQSPVDSTTVPVSNPAVDLGEIRELLDQERFAEALARLDRLRAISGDPDVAMLRALALVHAGRFADARAACDELLAISSTGAGASYVLALCCDSTGDIAGAARQATLAAELDPSFAMPRVHLGLLARRLGHRELAVRELTRAIALLEREAPARLALYGGGFSRQALLGMCHAELATISAAGATR
jgi:chemotaxis protein methyltransferase CheR